VLYPRKQPESITAGIDLSVDILLSETELRAIEKGPLAVF
jgi:hypothetical protein